MVRGKLPRYINDPGLKQYGLYSLYEKTNVLGTYFQGRRYLKI